MKGSIIFFALAIISTITYMALFTEGGDIEFKAVSISPSIESPKVFELEESHKLVSEFVSNNEKIKQTKFKRIRSDDLDKKTKARILKNIPDQEVFEKYLTPEELAYSPELADPREVMKFTFKNGKATQEKTMSTQPPFRSEFSRKLSLRFINHLIKKIDSDMENAVDEKKLQELQGSKEAYIREIRTQYNKKRFNENQIQANN